MTMHSTKTPVTMGMAHGEKCPIIEMYEWGDIEVDEIDELQSTCDCHLCESKRKKS